MRTGWKVFWLLGFIVLAGGEIVALYDLRPGDTLSEYVREVTPDWWRWLFLAGFLAWLTKHWLFDKRGK